LWPTRVLPEGSLRTRLERLADEHDIAIREMLIWETGNGTLNAAVSGMIPGLRYVFLTDGLLREMCEDEIEAIYAHELGHVKHGHLILRILALLLPMFACMGLTETIAWISPFTGQPSELSDSWLEPITLFATVGYMFFALGWYARRLEHQADLWACSNLSGTGTATIENHPYFRVLQRLTVQEDPSRAGWLHPSPTSRLRFLKTATTAPQAAARFEWQLHMLAVVMLSVATWAISILLLSRLG
ncbi:MAG: M48 family metalloprotease, partial [Planctomycetota bacterium]